jgi:protein-tyrosine-phosphatase
MAERPRLPWRVLFLCTANSARSQIAEALLNARHDPRITAGSAGTHPATQVNPHAVEVLRARGIDASAARPKTIDEVMEQPWEVVITVCDCARESCPVLPGHPAMVHWGVPDPAAAPDATKRHAFEETARIMNGRIERLLSLPLEKLEAVALKRELDAISGLPD